MKYETFNKQNLAVLRAQLEKVLVEFGPSDLEFSIGNIKFSSQDCSVDLKAKVKGGQSHGDVMLKTQMASMKLNQVSKTGEKLVSYKSANWKMPFIYTGKDGKSYKCSEERAQQLFGM